MGNFEYEYSFNVDSLDKYISYCINNGYKLMSTSDQTRTIYRKGDSTIARVTIDNIDGKIVKSLDFKENKLDDKLVHSRKESKALEFNSDDSVNSILEFLEYKKDNTLIRKRYVYSKDKVKFELDEYTSPSKTCVVAIEGDKLEVDKTYSNLKELIK